MVETEERRQYFVESVMRFILYFGFDGLDIDWEYPASRGGISDDKENFNRLLELFHEQLSKRNKILTAAVAASQYTIKSAYNIPDMCEYALQFDYYIFCIISTLYSIINTLYYINNFINFFF